MEFRSPKSHRARDEPRLCPTRLAEFQIPWESTPSRRHALGRLRCPLSSHRNYQSGGKPHSSRHNDNCPGAPHQAPRSRRCVLPVCRGRDEKPAVVACQLLQQPLEKVPNGKHEGSLRARLGPRRSYASRRWGKGAIRARLISWTHARLILYRCVCVHREAAPFRELSACVSALLRSARARWPGGSGNVPSITSKKCAKAPAGGPANICTATSSALFFENSATSVPSVGSWTFGAVEQK